jgi:predicted glutamine amidotransferase
MCELLALAATEAFPLGKMLRWAEGLEREGDAGYGWGVAWLPPAGRPLRLHKRPSPLQGDPSAEAIAGEVTRVALLHLRMPSDMSTVGLPDTQPFLDAAGSLAFAHNGYLARHQELRPRYAGALAGRADSEVGWLHFRSLVPELGVDTGLRRMYDEAGGPESRANLLVLEDTGLLHMYCANNNNRVCLLRQDGFTGFATTLHQDRIDGLQALFPRATLELLPVGSSRTIDPATAD